MMYRGDEAARRLCAVALFAVVILLAAQPGCQDSPEPGDAPDLETSVGLLSWFDDDWDHRKEIEVTEESGEKLTDYELHLEIDTETLIADGKMQSDCADLRFTDEDGDVLDFWLEDGCDSASTDIWVSVDLPADGTETVLMYYDNPEASSTSDRDATLTFYDSFADGSFGDWSTGGDTGGSGGSADQNITDSSYVVDGYSVELYADANCYSSPYDGTESWAEQDIDLAEGEYEVEHNSRLVDAGKYGFCGSDDERTVTGNGIYIDGDQIGDRPSCTHDGDCGSCDSDWEHSIATFEADGTTNVMMRTRAGDCRDKYQLWDPIIIRSHADPAPTYDIIGEEPRNHPPDEPFDPEPADGENVLELNPELQVDVTDPDGDAMDVTFYKADGTEIGTVTDVDSGSTAAVSTGGAGIGDEPGTTYGWYAVADDGEKSTESNTWQFTTVHEPDAPTDPSPADGADPVSLDTDLEVEVDHPDALAMDVTFHLDDGSGFEEAGTDSDVDAGTTASISPDLDADEQYDWYAVAEAEGLDADSDTWSFSTWRSPSVDSISFEDASDEHAFSVHAVVESPEGDDEIDGCELVVVDDQDRAQDYTMSVDRSWGDDTEARCSVDDVTFDDHDDWDHAAVVESDVDVEVTVQDSEGLSATDTESHSFPNNPPEIVEDPAFQNLDDRYGFDVSVVATDPDAGAEELDEGDCIVEHRLQGQDDDWNQDTTGLQAPYGGDEDRAICEFTILAEDEDGGVDGYEPGKTVEVRARVEDHHGEGVWSEKADHPIPFLGADHIALSASTTEQTVGEQVDLTAQVSDPNGYELDKEVEVSLQVSGAAGFEPNQTQSVDVTTDGADGAAEATLTNTVAEPVDIEVTDATLDGGALPASEPHHELTVDFQVAEANHATLTTPSEITAGSPDVVAVQIVDEFDNPVEQALEVCLSVEASEESVSLDAEQLDDAGDPGDDELCGTTGEDGFGSFELEATVAEQITVSSQTSGLPGSGIDDEEATLDVVPADPDHLRLTGPQEPTLACEDGRVDVHVVDEFDNPVQDPDDAAVEVTLSADADQGEVSITDTELEDAIYEAGPSVTGTVPEDGEASLEVSLDAADTVEVHWSSDELPADPDDFSGAQVDFVPGEVDAAESKVVTSGEQVYAYGGAIGVTVIPRDFCGVRLGTDRDVELEATFGELTPVQDIGDGTYSAEFSTGEDECPDEPAQITPVVDGVELDERPEITSICAEVDEDSPVIVEEGDTEVEACASGGVFARIEVAPQDPDGGPMPPGQEVIVIEDEPYIVDGGIDEEIDGDTGDTIYTAFVGSNRCSDEPREVEIRVGGVPMDTRPQIEFSCPPVVEDGVSFDADPREIPADGETAADVGITAVDSCGNPAFAREIELQPTGVESVELSDGQVETADVVGEPEDGTASVEITGDRAGFAGLEAEIDDHVHASDEELVELTLPEVLDVELSADADSVPHGEPVTITAELSSGYAGTLTELVLEPDTDNLHIDAVEGADPVENEDDDPHYQLDALESGETVAVYFDTTLVDTDDGRMHLNVEYGTETVEQRHGVESETVGIELAADPDTDSEQEDTQVAESGCGCAATGGSAPLSAAVVAVLLVVAVRIRRAVPVG